MKYLRSVSLALISLCMISALVYIANRTTAPASAAPAQADAPTYDINTLAGKVKAVRDAGLHFRLSDFLEQEADEGITTGTNPHPAQPITPMFVLSSTLDGTSVAAPDVTVNQDMAGAPQNETAIAVDPNNPSRIVTGMNDYVTRAWNCIIGGVPCSALGDGYSGTYFSNDGGNTWCCASKLDGSNIGTQIPGVEHLVGGQYDAGGDPSVAFDSRGNVFYAGLGFDRTAPPSTVAVNKGTFDAQGNLTWGPPTFINPSTSPSTLNDKPWVTVDSNSASPFRDRIYVTWTRFIFAAHTGRYVQSPISLVYSTDGGKTFSSPQLVSADVISSQGSRPVVGSDGTVYVFWDGSKKKATLNHIWVTKSTDGGVTWSQPVAIALIVDIIPLENTEFRVNSFPAAAVDSSGKLYVTWDSMVDDTTGGLCPAPFFTNVGCHAAALYSTSTDGGATWSAPALVFPALDASIRMPIGYPVMQPDGSMLNAPSSPRRVDTVYSTVAVSPGGSVYFSAYAADISSPWQTCAQPAQPTAVGRIDCLALGPYRDNARLDYIVADFTTGVTKIVTTHPINTQYGFGGGFIGDYTDIAVGSDNTFHAFWTDTNNVQSVDWFYGFEFAAGTMTNQQDVVVFNGSF